MSIEKRNAPGLKAMDNILSHVTTAGSLVFCSGQLPADEKGQLIPGDIKAHTKQCILNLEKVLQAAGAGLQNLVKVNIFLRSMDDFAAMNEVYEQVRPFEC